MSDGPASNAVNAAHWVLDPMDQLLGGIEDFLSALIAPFLWPVTAPAKLLLGDPDAMNTLADGWRAAVNAGADLRSAERDAATAILAQWNGEGADAFAAKLTAADELFVACLRDMESTATNLDQLADVYRFVEETIKSIIVELVIWLAVTWAAAQAIAWITAGASEVAAAGASAAESGVAVGRVAMVAAQLREALTAWTTFCRTLHEGGIAGRAAFAGLRYVAKLPVDTKELGVVSRLIGTATGLPGTRIGAILQGIGGTGWDVAEGVASDIDRRGEDDVEDELGRPLIP